MINATIQQVSDDTATTVEYDAVQTCVFDVRLVKLAARRTPHFSRPAGRYAVRVYYCGEWLASVSALELAGEQLVRVSRKATGEVATVLAESGPYG